MWQGFLSLIYPRNCVACGNSLFKHEEQICNYCYMHLPKTNFHLQPENPVAALFYGRVPINIASSFYWFKKKGGVQKILHDIKYKHNKELAQLIGKFYGEDLKQHKVLHDVQCIIPVPLHPKKLKQRGYNQSEEFAKGLADELQISLNTHALTRKEFTTTQTKKSKYERWENVETAFEVNDFDTLKHQHIILVDDVITTGATIEACCQALQKIEGVKISVLSIAFASL